MDALLEKKILKSLEKYNNGYHLPCFDYRTTAYCGARMDVFTDGKGKWMIVFQVVFYLWDSERKIRVMNYAVGNALKETIYEEGKELCDVSTHKNLINEDGEFIGDKLNFEIDFLGKKRTLQLTTKDYEELNVKIRLPDEILLAVYCGAKFKEEAFESPEQLLKHYKKEKKLNPFLTINNWQHPTASFEEIGDNNSFKMLAKAIAANDPSLYVENDTRVNSTNIGQWFHKSYYVTFYDDEELDARQNFLNNFDTAVSEYWLPFFDVRDFTFCGAKMNVFTGKDGKWLLAVQHIGLGRKTGHFDLKISVTGSYFKRGNEVKTFRISDISNNENFFKDGFGVSNVYDFKIDLNGVEKICKLTDKDYVDLGFNNIEFTEELVICWYCTAKFADELFKTPEEIIELFELKDLVYLMTIDKWEYHRLYGQKPSEQKTIQSLADAVVNKDPSLYNADDLWFGDTSVYSWVSDLNRRNN